MEQSLLDQVFLRPTRFLVPLLLLGVLLLLRRLAPPRLAQQLRDTPLPPERHKALPWFLAGLLFSGAAIGFLEYRRRGGVFLDDDNLTQFLPVILRGAEHFFATGHLPTWNPYQLMGAPTLSVGTYALTYPFTYLSYALARFCLHDPTRTLEVFCTGHLLGGYCAAFALSRATGLRPALSLCVALGWAWCGATLLCAWYYMAPLLVYVPLLFLGTVRLERQAPSWRWLVGFGAVLGLFAVAGNIQLWVYALLLLAVHLTLRVCQGALAVPHALAVGPALLLGLALATPTLLPSVRALSGIQRQGMTGYHLPAEGLLNLLFPYPLRAHPHLLYFPDPQNPAQHLETLWFYAGTPFVAVALWGGLFILAHRGRLPHWLLLGLLALLLGMGDDAPLWGLLARLPKLNQFQHAGKFLFFAQLFLSLAGGQALERLLRAGTLHRHGEAWFVGLTVAGLALHLCQLPERLFVDRGYPALPPGLAQALATAPPGRLLSIAPCQSQLPGYPIQQSQGFSTAYRVLNIGGYDPLVSQQAASRLLLTRFQASLESDPGAILRATGVRWVLVSPTAQAQTIQSDTTYLLAPFAPALLHWLPRHASLRLKTPTLALYELPQPDPLAFTAAQSLPIAFDEEGATVTLEPRATSTEVTVALLTRPGLQARSGRTLLPFTQDAWGRVVVHAPARTTKLRLEFPLPWQEILLLQGLLLLTSALGMAVLPKR